MCTLKVSNRCVSSNRNCVKEEIFAVVLLQKAGCSQFCICDIRSFCQNEALHVHGYVTPPERHLRCLSIVLRIITVLVSQKGRHLLSRNDCTVFVLVKNQLVVLPFNFRNFYIKGVVRRPIIYSMSTPVILQDNFLLQASIVSKTQLCKGLKNT